MCKWTQGNLDYNEEEVFYTECGCEFIMLQGTPTENDFLFCCYCGNILEEILIKD